MANFHSYPKIRDVKEATSYIKDHLGKSIAIVHTWGNGEGFTVELNDEDKNGKYVKEQRIELHWSQWNAIKMCVVELVKCSN